MSEATRNQQEVGETKSVPSSIFIEETIEERIEALAKMVRDIDDDYAALSARLNREMLEYQDRLKLKIVSELSEIHDQINRTLADIREKFVEKVRERIQAASSEEIAEALTGRLGQLVIATRPATRDEIKTGRRN